MHTLVESKEKGIYEIIVGNTENSRIDVAGEKKQMEAILQPIKAMAAKTIRTQKFIFGTIIMGFLTNGI
ncbi:MAG: hypothetical protein RBS19_04185 [Bacteroidales bacterium]|nr:hypothetical protein [Bacteroidales bacterium]MDY0216138.1 hypothetical protein [Bacteroidales bacterium]